MAPPTRFRAEPEGFVTVIVLSSGTPAVTVVPALSGASVILVPLKGEGELAWRALCVASHGE